MGPNGGGVDHHPDGAFAGRLGGHLGGELLQPSGEGPAAEAVVNGIP